VAGSETKGPDWLLAVVREAVWQHHPVDGREARSRHRILVALGRLPRPFDQRADPTHVTGSALIVGRRGVILHRHKRLGLWLQPGGHMEPDETPWDAALREAGEETGLVLEWGGLGSSSGVAQESGGGSPVAPGGSRLGRPRPPSGRGGSPTGPPLAHVDVHTGACRHIHLDLRYLLLVRGSDVPAPPPGESQEVRWFGWSEALQVADPGLAGLLRALAPAGSIGGV
jgi:8-oxo-dGTP pyrophosphatase MutT (NUDIX family)